MKFAEHLLAHITPEWRRQYIVYEDMKTILYEAVENLPTIETTDPQEIIRLTRAFDEDFLAFCEKELFKINVFYEEKLAEAKRKFDALKKEMDALALEQQQHQQHILHQQQTKASLMPGYHGKIPMPPTRSSFISTINLRQRNSMLHQQSFIPSSSPAQQQANTMIANSKYTSQSTSTLDNKLLGEPQTTNKQHQQQKQISGLDSSSNNDQHVATRRKLFADGGHGSGAATLIQQPLSESNTTNYIKNDDETTSVIKRRTTSGNDSPYTLLDDTSSNNGKKLNEQLNTTDTISLIKDDNDAISNNSDHGINDSNFNSNSEIINNDNNSTGSTDQRPPPPYQITSAHQLSQADNYQLVNQDGDNNDDDDDDHHHHDHHHDHHHHHHSKTEDGQQQQQETNHLSLHYHQQKLQRRQTKPRLSISAASAANLIKSPLNVLKNINNGNDPLAWDVAILGSNKENDDEHLIKTPTSPHMHPLAIRPGVDKKKLHDLKLAFSEFYLSLVLLQNYQRLNFTGFRKIFKKHDKLLGNEVGKRWHHEHVECAFFNTNKDVDKLVEETENIVTCHLEAGDRQRAMKRLRVPPLNDTPKPWTVFRVGFLSGAFLMLVFAVALTGLFQQTGDDWRIVFRLYRSSLFIVIFIFLVGINIYGWRAHGVNHVLIFELDPRDHLGAQDLLEISFTFGVLWCISVLLFLWSGTIGIPPLINPLILNSVMILYLLNPTKTLHHNARIWLLTCLGRIVAAPFYRVRFADFWLADQLNSLVPVLLDIEYTSCFYLTSTDLYGNVDLDRCVIREPKDLILRSIVACLPAWWRFAQCVRRYFDENRRANPHLLNAGKYATVWMVVLFSTLTEYTQDNYISSTDNPFFFCWITSLIFSSCYTYTWDIKMDWGLADPKAPKEYRFLREEIVYPAKYYYVAMVQDLIFRFGWTLSVSLTEVGAIPPDLITLVLAPCEIVRRFLWNFYRLENEHLNNCGEFRAVRDISISGQNIDLSALNRIIKVMDEPDGLSVFRKRMKSRLMAAKKKAMVESMDPSVVLNM